MKVSEYEIHIYKTPISTFHSQLDEFKNLLSSDEVKRAHAFKFDIHRDRFIVCRALLRKLLGKYSDQLPEKINFSYSEKGKPFLENSFIRFNLSHSNDYVVYAITRDHDLGIDIEFIKLMPDALEIANRFFSDEEISLLRIAKPLDIEKAFLNCWTRKEAFIKCVGEGLSYPLKDFAVTLLPGENPQITWIKESPEETRDWSLMEIEVSPQYVSSLAIKSRDVEIKYQSLNLVR